MENTEKIEQGMHKGCPSCGGMLRYDIARADLECQSCGEHYAPSRYAEEERTTEMDVVEYRCPQCGAKVHTTQTNMVSYCSFCGSEVLFQERMTRTRRPDKIVPFRISKAECERRYSEFMGAELAAGQRLNFQPVYVPFYFYRESFVGDGTINYTEETREEKYIHTSTYAMDAQAEVLSEGELECASGQFERETANRLKFSTERARDFLQGYLCGMYAEAPDLDAAQEIGDLSLYASRTFHAAALQKTDKRVSSVALPARVKDEAELWLLPVWLLAQAKGGRVLYTAVNGDDGHVVCDKPVKQSRISWMGVGCTVLIFALLMLVSQLIILRGNVIAGLCALISAAGFYCINRVLDRHMEREEEWKAARKSGRCSVVTTLNAERISTKDALFLGTLPSWPMLILLGAALVFGVIFAVGWAMDFPPLVIVGGMVSIALVIGGLGFITATWGDYTKLKAMYQRRGTFVEWLLFHGLFILQVALVVFVVHVLTKNMNSAVAGLVSDGAWLPPMLCASSVISLMISGCKYRQSWIDTALYTLQIVFNAVVGFAALMGTMKHTFFLAASVVMLLPTILAAGRVIARHNEFVTRPVPYFNEKGELK